MNSNVSNSIIRNHTKNIFCSVVFKTMWDAIDTSVIGQHWPKMFYIPLIDKINEIRIIIAWIRICPSSCRQQTFCIILQFGLMGLKITSDNCWRCCRQKKVGVEIHEGNSWSTNSIVHAGTCQKEKMSDIVLDDVA